MWRKRKLYYLIFAVFCLALIAGLTVFVAGRQEGKICNKVYITIDNEFNNYFISDREVKDILTANGTSRIEGLKVEEIDLKSLEMRIKSHKFVQDAQVFRDLAGNINIKIKQNRPIARIIHPDSEQDVYIDAEGHVLPLSDRFTARVLPIARAANAPSLTKGFFQDSTGKEYLALIKFIDNDAFWKAQLAQMFIDGRGKISFLPQVGNEIIEFGRPQDVEQKFKKILVFYKKVLPAMGWDKYKRVNVEYNDQIICE
ncbi:MAG: cell division protein FtsQ/DivIB [Adhaeribacter sp.]